MIKIGYGRRGGGRGAGRGFGMYPGNGPFSHLPPWERPGWLYGRGSCWALGYWQGTPTVGTTTPPPLPTDLTVLKNQKEILETQLKTLQESLERIEARLRELEKT